MHKKLLIFFLILICITGGVFFLSQQKKSTEEKNLGTVKTGSDTQKSNSPGEFSGTVLAGNASPYIEFNREDFEKAVKEKKIVFLEFYANWCPICRSQEPKLFEGFNSLNDSSVVGFRLNYNDDATDEFEKQLAKDFGVTYQHTHVILKDGKVVHKSSDDLDKDSFTALIESVKK